MKRDSCSRICGLLLPGSAESKRRTSPLGVVVSMRRAARDSCSVATPAASTSSTCQRFTLLTLVVVSAFVSAIVSDAVVTCSTLYVSTCPGCQWNRHAGAWAEANGATTKPTKIARNHLRIITLYPHLGQAGKPDGAAVSGWKA